MPKISIKNVFFLKLLNRKLPPPSVSQTRAWPGLGISEEMRCQRLLWRAAKEGKTTTLTFGQTYKHISSDLLSVPAMSDCLLFCARGEERRREIIVISRHGTLPL